VIILFVQILQKITFDDTLLGNKKRTATWKVYEWKVFHRLVEARKKGFIPEKIEDFEKFKLAYLAALYRQEFSKF